MRSSLLLATALVAGAVSAQSPLTTTFAGGNGLTASGSTNYFDLNVKVGIAVTQLDCNIWTGGISTTINVWTIAGTHVGNETNSAAWTLVGSATNAAPVANGTPSPFIFNTPFALQPGLTGVAIEYVGDGMAYTNGTAAGNLFASNAELDFYEGGSTGALFTATQFSPRVWNGSIYYQPLTGFATATSYGDGCGGTQNFASYAETFAAATSFDLGSTPGAETVLNHLNGGSGFVVLPGAPNWFTPVAPDLVLGDDQVSAAQSLGFSMTMPGGLVVTDVYICSNGYIWLQQDTTADFTPSLAELVNGNPRIAMAWQDLTPPNGGTIHFDSDPVNGVAYVTFLGVAQFGSPETITMQCALFANGSYELRYSTETISTAGVGAVIVGYSPGNGALSPPNSDLSVLPIFTQPDLFVPNLSLSSDRPVEGTNMNITIDNIPAGTVLGTLVLSATQINPGVQPLPGLGNCVQLVGLNDVFYYLPTSSTEVLTFPVPAAGFTGVQVFAQAITLSPGINPVGIASSNGLAWTVDAN